jgi:hypothetical protein
LVSAVVIFAFFSITQSIHSLRLFACCVAVLLALCAGNIHAQTRKQMPDPTVLYPLGEISLKAVVRDVIFRQTPPKRSRVGLFEQIFLPSHHSPASDLIAREFLFADGDEVPPSYIFQSALNLRSSGLFRTVNFELDTTKLKRIDVTVILEERPQVAPFLIAETGGGVASVGVGVDFANLSEGGFNFRASGQYRTYNGIGWQAAADLDARHVLDWFNLKAHVLWNRYRNEQELTLAFPFSADSPYFEGELTYSRGSGQEFLYKPLSDGTVLEVGKFDLKAFESNRISLFGAVRGWSWDSEFFLMAQLVGDATRRADSSLVRIGDNGVQAHLGIALERRNIAVPDELLHWNRYGTPTIGWFTHAWFGILGTAAINYRYPLNVCLRAGVAGFLGERVYVQANAELNGRFGTDNSLIFVDFANRAFFNTSVNVSISKDIVFAGRILFEAVNPLLRPRNGAGSDEYVLRGFGLNTVIGPLREIARLELRGLPIAEVGVYRLTGAIFLDAAQARIFQTIDYLRVTPISCGAGLRLKYPAFAGGEGTIRVDVAFVPSLGRFGQIIVSTQEAFTLFEDFPSKQQRVLGEQRWIE